MENNQSLAKSKAILGHFLGPRLIGVPSGTQRYNQFLSRTPGSMKTGISVSLFPPGQPGMGAQFGIWVPVDQGAQGGPTVQSVSL